MIRVGRKIYKKLNKRYLGIGISVYIIELVVIVVAGHLGASAVTSVGISYWVGLVIAFVLQKFVVFNSKALHHKILLPQILAFSVLVLFNFAFTLLVTKLLSPPLPAVISRSLALAITVIWNYYLYKSHIFSSKTANLG